MPNDFFPDTDAGIRSWTQILVEKLEPDPGVWGVPQALFDEYAQTVADFAAALVRRTDPALCTRGDIAHKNQLKTQVELDSREIARLILAQPGLTLEQRISFGFGDPKQRVRRAAAPQTAPGIELQPGYDRSVNLRLLKSTSPYRGRAPGAAGALIFFQAAPRPSPGLDDWTFYDVTTETRLNVRLPGAVEPGSVLWFKACWVNARFARGPMSRAVQTRLFDDSGLPDVAKIAA